MKELDVNSAIAGEIMTPYVIKLNIDAELKDVTKLISDNQISAVFIQGIAKDKYFVVSKSDIVDFLNNGGLDREDLANLPVTEIMHGPIDMLDVDTPVDRIIRYMTKYNYKRVLISKDRKATGVISPRDIMKWNNTYFKPAKPQILLFMDNKTSNFIGRHIFEENIERDLKHELLDLYGGALSTISFITEAMIEGSGKMSHLIKEKCCVLFEQYENITGILICDYNNIELRFKLRKATKKFYSKYADIFQSAAELDIALHNVFDIGSIIFIFNPREKLL